MDLANVELNSYYSNITNQIGESLKLALRTTIQTGINKRSYGEARYILSYSDRNPQNQDYLIGMYDNDIIVNYWIGEGNGAWQREHVWPNSKLGIPRVDNNSRNIGSDLHNLRAISGSTNYGGTGINQTRSNRYFDIAEGPGPSTIGTDAFYPSDNHKGDVARILFYMIVMYPQLDLTDVIENLINNPDTNYTLAGAYMGKYEVLLNWHLEDPVDEFEMRRNNFIYSGIAVDPDTSNPIAAQGNRNPFIDRPYYLQWLLKDGYPANAAPAPTGVIDFGRLVYAPYTNILYS